MGSSDAITLHLNDRKNIRCGTWKGGGASPDHQGAILPRNSGNAIPAEDQTPSRPP